MTIIDASWSMIIGLALMFVGGLVLWAYGARRASTIGKLAETGIESEATRQFHQRLSRWFFIYGGLIITLGLALLLWAASNFFET
jgi:hypothetical protein